MQASESRIATLKQQHTAGLKNEATMAAEAEAHVRNLHERDQTLRRAAQHAGIGQLPEGAISEHLVTG